MNFELTITASIAKVTVKTIQKDDIVRRVCSLTLAREFDDTLAAALGGEARKTLDGLRSRGVKDATLPIGAIVANAKLICGTQHVTIPVMKGVSAKAKISSNEEFPPSIKLEFEFDFFADAWVFLGRHCAAWADVELKEANPQLPFPKPTTVRAST